jgi:hypothetical protein
VLLQSTAVTDCHPCSASLPPVPLQLLDLEASGVSTAPQQKISLPELSAQVGGFGWAADATMLADPGASAFVCLPACSGKPAQASLLLTPPACAFLLALQCDTEASATRLFDQLRASLGAGTAALCIKPAHACNGLGAMRATSGQDLMVYAQVGGRAHINTSSCSACLERPTGCSLLQNAFHIEAVGVLVATDLDSICSRHASSCAPAACPALRCCRPWRRGWSSSPARCWGEGQTCTCRCRQAHNLWWSPL